VEGRDSSGESGKAAERRAAEEIVRGAARDFAAGDFDARVVDFRLS